MRSRSCVSRGDERSGVLRPVCVLAAALIAASACGSSSQSTTVAPSPVRCQTSIASSPTTFPARGGSGTLSVTAARECAWTVTAQASWIAVKTADGQGAATVEYSVAPNPAAEVRRGSLAVGSQVASITQEAAPCRFDVDRRTFALTPQEARRDIDVRALAGCAWTARSLTGWIAVIAGAEHTGDGRVTFRASANPGTTARSGALEVAGERIDVRQAGVPCTYAIDPAAADGDPAAFEGAFAVRTDAGCPWTAESDQPWLSVLEGATGEGAGHVRFGAEPNGGASARTGRITAGGRIFTVHQRACVFTVGPLSASYSALGGVGEIDVQAPLSCAWTAEPDVSWIAITSGASASGTGRVRYRVGVNPRTGTRSGSIAVAGHRVSIVQTGLTSVSGQVSAVEGSCPNRRFTVRGQRVRVTRDTDFEGGTCGGIRKGVTVGVNGFVGSDGVLTAREVNF